MSTIKMIHFTLSKTAFSYLLGNIKKVEKRVINRKQIWKLTETLKILTGISLLP